MEKKLFVGAWINKQKKSYKVYRIAGTKIYKLYVEGLYRAEYKSEKKAKAAGSIA